MDRPLVQGFLSIFGARVVRTVIAVITLPLIVRVLGPGGYGDYAFLMSTFSLYMIFVSSGVTEGAQKFAAEQRHDEWTRQVVGYYVRLAAVLAAVGTLGLVAVTATGVVGRVLGEEYTLYFTLLGAFVVTTQFRELGRRFLLAFGLELYSESLKVASKVIWVTVGLVLAWIGFGVAGMIAGHLVATALVALVGFWLVFRQVPFTSVFEPLPEEFPRTQFFSFNTLNILLVLLTMSLYHVDIVMLGMLAGSEATGYYRAALALAEYLWLVPISLQALLLHSTSALWSEEKRERIDDLAARITRYTVLFTGLLAVGIAGLAEQFVPLYFGSDFTPAIVPILLLLPGTIGFAAARPIIAISQARGDLQPLIAATGTAAAINLVLNVLLIPPYGMIGAAVATSVGYGSMFAFHVITARYLGYDPVGDLRIGRVVATTAATGAVVFLLVGIIEAPLLALVVVPVAGGVVHLGSAIATGAVDVEEIRGLLSSVPIPLPIGQ